MSKLGVMPPALFKATVDSAALGLAEEKPTGFSVNDVAIVLGFGEISRAFRKKVRQRLTTLCKRGRLFSPDRGIYLAPDITVASFEATNDPVLLSDLHRAFVRAGGFMQMPDILVAVGLDGTDSERRVRAVLSESPLFDRFTPLEGLRKHWRLSDSERAAIPVPGRWLMADLQLKVFKAGQGHIPWKWGLQGALEATRVRIGNGLRDARLLWGMPPQEVVADPAFSTTLDACLSGAESLPYLDAACPDDTGYKVAEWWADCKAGMGLGEALVEAWMMFEGGEHHPHLLDALDVASWQSIGARFRLDPALLSRGAIDIDWRGV